MSILLLKDFRETYGMSREEQADLLGITIDTLNNWEYRNKEIPKSKVKNVKYVFDMYKKGENQTNVDKELVFRKNGVTIQANDIVDWIYENQDRLKKENKYFALVIQDMVNEGIKKTLEESGFKVSYEKK